MNQLFLSLIFSFLIGVSAQLTSFSSLGLAQEGRVHLNEFLNWGGFTLFADLPQSIDEYNQRYLEYYEYSHLQAFLLKTRSSFQKRSYKTEVIGQSVQGRDLYFVGPEKIDSDKKIIVMLGRHHGDEGTANWIIEGFINKVLEKDSSFFENYQLLLYPMINPDGAQSMRRYNANARDLNREWNPDPKKSRDEAGIIQRHLMSIISQYKKQVSYVLDMHGSHTEDFIYRVPKDFLGEEFFYEQQKFIDTLSRYDRWQNGRYHLSKGHQNMARIFFVRDFQLNALTHETIKNLPLAAGRAKDDLFSQGQAIAYTLQDLADQKVQLATY